MCLESAGQCMWCVQPLCLWLCADTSSFGSQTFKVLAPISCYQVYVAYGLSREQFLAQNEVSTWPSWLHGPVHYPIKCTRVLSCAMPDLKEPVCVHRPSS